MRTRKPRFTIERIRTLVLGAGCLLIFSIIGFLAVGRWRNHLSLREIPKRLGANIQQEANGVTYTQAHGGHTLFKIHASKVVELKDSGKAMLHDVQIELYGADGSRVDRIAGNEFEYDQKQGKAVAAGPVEITLVRPGEVPAMTGRTGANRPQSKGTVLSNAAQIAAKGEIHVRTSGLTFDSKSGIASTQEKVDFSVQQGSGSSVGALFDSDRGTLTLDRAVELNLRRGNDVVNLKAQHAEFERGDLVCRMKEATAEFRGGQASAGSATVLFRPDGSASSLQAAEGLTLRSSQARLSAPRGFLQFNEQNKPQRGRLEGGTALEADAPERQMRAAAPSADLAFTPDGILRHAHLERGVTMHSENVTRSGKGGEEVHVARDWKSPIAELDFREPRKGQVELASVRGTGGVTVAGQTRTGNGPALPSQLSADEVSGTLSADQELTALHCLGHASLEQANAAGTRQTITGDQIDATLAGRAQGSAVKAGARQAANGSSQIESATVKGNVVLLQTSPKGSDSSRSSGKTVPTAMRATAGMAVYDGAKGWLHLLNEPRVEDGQLQLSAAVIDVAHDSGDALAHGNVKATWLSGDANPKAAASIAAPVGFGGQGPAHVVANEANVQQSSGEVTFRGGVRMWQQANSITAPTIVLNRQKQTLVARGNGAAEPVRMVLLSTGSPEAKSAGKSAHAPSIVRVEGEDLKYSEAERKALMRGGAAGVVARLGEATSQSSTVELLLLPTHNHVAEDGGAAQVDRVIAAGDVRVSSMGRRGLGDKLVYSSASGEYVLTGTPASPPKLLDPARGTVMGESLRFNGRDGSVSIEGEGQKTATQTSVKK